MPELPEVETVCRGLAPHIEGRYITGVLVRNASLRQNVPPDFASIATGLLIRKVFRRAKYILLECSSSITLICHLGMSGSLVLRPEAPSTYRKHEHVVFGFSDGTHLIYHDPRRFGLMLYCQTSALPQHPVFAALGPEPLDATWKAGAFYQALQQRHAPIKTVIMDQKTVVGIGNIYACEALFLASVHPARPASTLSKEEARRLQQSIRSVLQDAIRSGGSTLRDYVRSSGDPGYFQHQFNVYGHRALPCHSCGTPIDLITQAGRSTFFCPQCQCPE